MTAFHLGIYIIALKHRIILHKRLKLGYVTVLTPVHCFRFLFLCVKFLNDIPVKKLQQVESIYSTSSVSSFLRLLLENNML